MGMKHGYLILVVAFAFFDRCRGSGSSGSSSCGTRVAPALALVEFTHDILVDLFKHFLGEGSEKLPRLLQTLKNITVLVWTLCQKASLEFFGEAKVQTVIIG